MDKLKEMSDSHKILTCASTLKTTSFEEFSGFLTVGSIEEEAVG